MDDVEGVIKFVHEMLSDIFDVKQFLDCAIQNTSESKKNKLTQSWSSAIEQEQKVWDSLIERLDRVTLSKRGDRSKFVANQAPLPQKGQFTARAQFHRAPVELPATQIQEDLWLL